MHIHLGAMDFLKVGCYMLIFVYIWTTVAAHLSHTSFGRAMSYFF